LWVSRPRTAVELILGDTAISIVVIVDVDLIVDPGR